VEIILDLGKALKYLEKTRFIGGRLGSFWAGAGARAWIKRRSDALERLRRFMTTRHIREAVYKVQISKRIRQRSTTKFGTFGSWRLGFAVDARL
jgi:hypothetical protein